MWNRRVLPFLVPFLLVGLCGCSTQMMQQFGDGLAAIGGRGGTIARHDSFTDTTRLARELAKGQPPATWESVFLEEAADFIHFIDRGRVLVGSIGAEAYLGSPVHGKVVLYDVRSGTKLWEAGRRNLHRGRYSVVTTSPLIVLGGANNTSVVLMAIDTATGATRWEKVAKPPFRVAAGGPGKLILLANSGGPAIEVIDIASGQSMRRIDLKDEDADAKRNIDLIVIGDEVYVVGRKLTRLSARTGEVIWSRDVAALGRENAAVTPVPGGLLIWSPDEASYVNTATGAVRWTQGPGRGKFRLFANLNDDIYRIVARPHAAGRGVTANEDSIELVDKSRGSPLWLHATGGRVVSPLAANAGLILYSLDHAIVGLHSKDGSRRFSTRFTKRIVDAAPSGVPEFGIPDKLLVRRGILYVSRERAGVSAYELPNGRALWFQQNYEVIEGAYPYSAVLASNALKTSLAMHGVQTGQDSATRMTQALANVGNIQSDRYIRASQERVSWLARERASAMARGDTSKAIMASSQMEVEKQMQRFSGQMATAQQILSSAVALSGAIEQALRQEALQGMVSRVVLTLNHTMHLHDNAFQGRYHLRPFLDRGHGVTIVDLDTGRRADLIYSPHIMAVENFGVNLPYTAVDPDGRRLITVGVGLNADRYQETVKWKHRLPKTSVLAFDVARLRFVERNQALEATQARQEKLMKLPEQAFAGNLIVVRRLLDRGADINQRYHTGGFTALMFASKFGHEAVVQLLIERGADVTITNNDKQTAIDVAANSRIKELLRLAGTKSKGP